MKISVSQSKAKIREIRMPQNKVFRPKHEIKMLLKKLKLICGKNNAAKINFLKFCFPGN